MAPMKDPALLRPEQTGDWTSGERPRVPWYRRRPAVREDELRLHVVLAAVTASALAGWQIALIIHGAVLATAAVAVLPGRHLP